MAIVDPTKSPDEIVEDIETAEEDENVDQLLAYLSVASNDDHAGDEDWTEVAEGSLDAFYRLIKAGGTTDRAGSFVQEILNALEAWKDEEAIVEVALGCLVAIASKAAPNDEDDSSSSVSVDIVFEVMKEYTSESTIQEQACLAIEGLALWKTAWKDSFASSEGIRDELMKARNERIANERNKKYPVQAAKALGLPDFDGSA